MGHSLKTADARYYLRKKQMSAATAGKTIRCLYAYTSPEKTPENSPERTPKMSPQRTPRKKWSPEEILIMKDAYKETSTEAFTPSKQLKSFCQENNLCERLNSTETQIINKLHSLKRYSPDRKSPSSNIL